MKNYVEGYIKASITNEYYNQLQTLGYELQNNKFRKYGQLEAVVNELVPFVEGKGINVFDQLYLAEYAEDGNLLGKYENGKIKRFDS